MPANVYRQGRIYRCDCDAVRAPCYMGAMLTPAGVFLYTFDEDPRPDQEGDHVPTTSTATLIPCSEVEAIRFMARLGCTIDEPEGEA